MKRIFVFAFLFLTQNTIQAQHTNRYCNGAFPFCVDVPGNFNRVGKSDTGDGQNFVAKDGSTLSVFGLYNTENETVAERFEREQAALLSDTSANHSAQIPSITKTATEANSFTIFYQTQDYNYVIFRKLENQNWLSLEMKYPAAKPKDYEEKVNRMIGSFN